MSEHDPYEAGVEELMSELGFCVTCCDAGIPMARLSDCGHPGWSVDVHDTSDDTLTVEAAADHLKDMGV